MKPHDYLLYIFLMIISLVVVSTPFLYWLMFMA
jgi:hypothetical protein